MKRIADPSGCVRFAYIYIHIRLTCTLARDTHNFETEVWRKYFCRADAMAVIRNCGIISVALRIYRVACSRYHAIGIQLQSHASRRFYIALRSRDAQPPLARTCTIINLFSCVTVVLFNLYITVAIGFRIDDKKINLRLSTSKWSRRKYIAARVQAILLSLDSVMEFSWQFNSFSVIHA